MLKASAMTKEEQKLWDKIYTASIAALLSNTSCTELNSLSSAYFIAVANDASQIADTAITIRSQVISATND